MRIRDRLRHIIRVYIIIIITNSIYIRVRIISRDLIRNVSRYHIRSSGRMRSRVGVGCRIRRIRIRRRSEDRMSRGTRIMLSLINSRIIRNRTIRTMLCSSYIRRMVRNINIQTRRRIVSARAIRNHVRVNIIGFEVGFLMASAFVLFTVLSEMFV